MNMSKGFKDAFDRLIGEFGASIGIPDLEFDEDGLCHIRIDESYPITFRRDDERHRLSTIGLISDSLPASLDGDFVRDILVANIAPLREDGPAIGVEPTSGTVVLYRNVPLSNLDMHSFQQMLGNFIELQKSWVDRFMEQPFRTVAP